MDFWTSEDISDFPDILEVLNLIYANSSFNFLALCRPVITSKHKSDVSICIFVFATR